MAKTLDEMDPSEIVQNLDKYIIGQDDAKKLIAIAIRNRTRRKRLSPEIREEVSPKNILMIGSTGIGKTEIARRISKLANAPFIKVEATKYTEVGYVGRDVESMVRDLMAASIHMVMDEAAKTNGEKVEEKVTDRIVDLLLPTAEPIDGEISDSEAKTREVFCTLVKSGKMDDKLVEVQAPMHGKVQIGMLSSGNQMDDVQDALRNITDMFQKPRTKKVTVKRAKEIFKEEEVSKFIDNDKVIEEARERCEQMGIIFIDEIDKIAQKGGDNERAEVSREGVQRDILPIVEGTKVSTKWGTVDTTNILFIAAGAFSLCKPSDLIPELQGRFPIRVELKDLTAGDFYRILTEPQNAITKQYEALLQTEDVKVEYTEEGLRRISELAEEVNHNNENIGARRLYTIMEKLLEEVSFNADKIPGQTVTITKEYVDKMLGDIAASQDLSRYIL